MQQLQYIFSQKNWSLVRFIVVFRFFLLAGQSCLAQDSFYFDVKTGVPFNAPTKLVIEQNGYDDIVIRKARFESKEFVPPIYWDVRLGYKSYSLQLMHHKLNLLNEHPNIQSFSVSHGYNMLLFGKSFPLRYFDYTLGAGLVIAHPENTVNEQNVEDNPNQGFAQKGYFKGYFIDAPVIYGAFQRRQSLWRGFFAVVESKVTWSRAWVNVYDGEARFWNLSAHFQFGLGYEFGTKEK